MNSETLKREIKNGFADKKKNDKVKSLMLVQGKLDKDICDFLKNNVERIPQQLIDGHNKVADELEKLSNELIEEIHERHGEKIHKELKADAEAKEAEKKRQYKSENIVMSRDNILGLVKTMRHCANLKPSEDCGGCPNASMSEDGHICQDTMLRDAAVVIENLLKDSNIE